MTRHRSGLAVAFGLTLALAVAAEAAAAPPQINGIAPFGVQRGVASEMTVNGANLVGNPRLVAPFGVVAAVTTPGAADPANWKLKLTVDPAAAVGVYPVRVQTDDGLSNLFLFSVGQLAQVAEKEDNSTFETAQPITAPTVVEGQAAANDVDYFRFAGKKGQTIVVDAQCARIGSGVDPSVRLTTAARGFVASADDSPGLLTDARLVAVLPEDAEYVIELSDSRYQGGGRPVYRLVVGALPVAEEVYPISGRAGETVGLELRGGTLDGLKLVAARPEPWAGIGLARVRAGGAMLGLAGPQAALDVESLPALIVADLPELREPADPAAPPLRAALPVVLNGRIDPAGDEDRFVLAVTPGQKLRIEVEAADSGSSLDGVLQVLGAKGAVLATADDTVAPPTAKAPNKPAGIVSPDPSLESFTVPAGLNEVTLALRDLSARGGTGFPYRISVTTVTPGFDLTLNESQVSVPKGGTTAVGVTVVRKGYNGPIALKVANPPAGLTFRPGSLADGQALGAFTVSAAADAPPQPFQLAVVGEGQGADGSFVVRAGKTLVFATQATLPTNTLVQVGLAASTASPVALALDLPAGPVEVAHGHGVPIPVKAARGKDAAGPLALTALTLPPGLAVPAATIAEKAAEGTVTVNTTTDHPLGIVSIVLVAKGKVGGAERSVVAPALTLSVVRPAAVTLASAALEIKAGATVELKGKVVRKGAFQAPVTVKVNALPPGLKADPVTVAPAASDFTLKITADPKAAPATAAGNVALAFQINKKDYPAPTAPLSVKVLPAK